jgi:membrane protein required for colicin V production
MVGLHWIDYAIIAVIGLSVITGLLRGFVKELIALCVWALAIWLAVTYSQTVSVWFASYISDASARSAVAFVATLIATLIVGGLFNALLSFILQRSGLSGTDRVLGMGFGLVRGLFIVALLMLVVKMTSLPYEEYRAKSSFYVLFDPLVDWLYQYTPDFIKQMKVLDNSTMNP